MKTIMTAAALMVGIAGISESAKAHSFNVAMVIALAEPSIADAAQVRNGFLLSTRERDSHPDEESDGHLGGLDVYLYTVDLGRESLSRVSALLQRGQIDILAVAGPEEVAEEIRPLVRAHKPFCLSPGDCGLRLKGPLRTHSRRPSAIRRPRLRPKATTLGAESMRPCAGWVALATGWPCDAPWPKPGTV